MKISTKSLHYRWINYLTKELTSELNVPSNLCGYFWHFLALNLWGLFVFAFVSVVTVFLAAPILYFFTSINFGAVVAAGSLELLFLVLFIISYSYDKGGFAAVVINYLKAVKGKYCPQIEFTE